MGSGLDWLARFFLTLGILFVVIGGVLLIIQRLPGLHWLGRLPGDIYWKRGHVEVYIPLMTSLVISLLLTLLLNLLFWMRKQ